MILYRLLEALETVTEELVNEDQEEIIILQDSFAISIQNLDVLTYNGTRVSAFTNGSGTYNICTDSGESECEYDQTSAAEIQLPPDIFEYASNLSSNTIISVVFVNDALFLRRDKVNKEVATVILSVSVAGTVISGLNDSYIDLMFQKIQSPVS